MLLKKTFTQTQTPYKKEKSRWILPDMLQSHGRTDVHTDIWVSERISGVIFTNRLSVLSFFFILKSEEFESNITSDWLEVEI